jgi:hypothetical protein
MNAHCRPENVLRRARIGALLPGCRRTRKGESRKSSNCRHSREGGNPVQRSRILN